MRGRSVPSILSYHYVLCFGYEVVCFTHCLDGVSYSCFHMVSTSDCCTDLYNIQRLNKVIVHSTDVFYNPTLPRIVPLCI